MKKIIPILIVVSVALIVWYFYPCLTFKGTYSDSWSRNSSNSIIKIDDNFNMDDEIIVDYRLDIFGRKLWLDFPVEEHAEIPVLLRWNKIRRPVVHMEEGEYRKIK